MAVDAGVQSGLLMDRIYRHQRHIYDITRKYYLLGRDRLIRDLQANPDDAVLEIGCGTARNLVKTAKHYPAARCFGVDISEEMLATASASIARHRLSERITLARADATNFDGAALFGQPRFERIILAYCLSMMPSWRATLERAANGLAPGGKLSIIDFGELSGWPSWFHQALLWWLKRFHVTPRADLSSYAQHIASSRGLSMTRRDLYRGYARFITIERPHRS
ncbi:MAG: class I SAM-dependent methyltransferase [Pseudomonadota bacterium]